MTNDGMTNEDVGQSSPFVIPSFGHSSFPSLIAIAVVSHASRFLVGPRPPGVPLAGLWEFPGGKVQPVESPAEAAVRECREETGLKVRVVGEYPSATHDYPHGRLRLHFFACQLIDADAALLPLPPFRWVDAAALAELPFPEANAELLRTIAGTAKSR